MRIQYTHTYIQNTYTYIKYTYTYIQYTHTYIHIVRGEEGGEKEEDERKRGLYKVGGCVYIHLYTV